MIFTNPSIFFVLLWLSTGLLYSLHLSNVLLEMKYETYLLLFISCMGFLLAYLLYFITVKKPILYPKYSNSLLLKEISNMKVYKKIKYLWLFWIVMIIFEILFEQNLPLIALFGIGPYIGYADFGISGLHGFLNSISFVLITYHFLKYKASSSKIDKYVVIFFILWTILIVNRQQLVSIFLELMFLHFITTKIKFKQILKVFFIIMLFITIFGFIGDMRSGKEHFLAIASPTFDYPEYLPSGFLWIYIYMVSPLNNTNYNIENFEPIYIPISSTILLFPSFLRDQIESTLGIKSNPVYLVHESLNMSSFFPTLLNDFGLELIFFILFFTALFFLYVMHKANYSLRYVFVLSIILHAIAMSIFTNFLTHIVFVMQIFIVLFIFKSNKLQVKYDT